MAILFQTNCLLKYKKQIRDLIKDFIIKLGRLKEMIRGTASFFIVCTKKICIIL